MNPIIDNGTFVKVRNITTNETHYGILSDLLGILLSWGEHCPIEVEIMTSVHQLINPLSKQ